MANVHRAYVIQDDAYYIRVEGGSELHKFTGRTSDKDSYTKLRALILAEQRKDPKSKMIDHAQAT